ncbi:hypothetical protein SLA_2410 [Streptomyces laurentii]|uniref:Uncharacterized protein n=1 Tax=Streptomyces laurentii TaxID=39478 RepID=A0A160NX20_STRLU|nr:hypothetical protein SLA_2410 [Streptomyces laurentii]
MPEHKMVIVNGVRVRAEDEARYRRRRTVVSEGGQAAPLTRAQAKPKQDDAPEAGGGFDPSQYTVLQVIAYLAEADMEETARVLDVEASSDARKGLLERREEFLAEARQREAAGGFGGGA